MRPGSRAQRAYGVEQVNERHRHRYELNNRFRDALEQAGMVWSGISPDGLLVEIAELRDHPWMVGSQFHPEFKTRPNTPHPLFREFIGAAIAYGRRATGQVGAVTLGEQSLTQ